MGVRLPPGARSFGYAWLLRLRFAPLRMTNMQHAVTRRTALAALSTAALFPNIARGQSVTNIVVGGLPEDSATSVLYGIQSGLFKKYGLNVEMQPHRNGPAVMSAGAGTTYPD